jgi:hypothetical protein
MRARSTLKRILAAFSEAVAEGDYARAEAWFRVARYAHERLEHPHEAERRKHPRATVPELQREDRPRT